MRAVSALHLKSCDLFTYWGLFLHLRSVKRGKVRADASAKRPSAFIHVKNPILQVIVILLVAMTACVVHAAQENSAATHAARKLTYIIKFT